MGSDYLNTFVQFPLLAKVVQQVWCWIDTSIKYISCFGVLSLHYWALLTTHSIFCSPAQVTWHSRNSFSQQMDIKYNTYSFGLFFFCDVCTVLNGITPNMSCNVFNGCGVSKVVSAKVGQIFESQTFLFYNTFQKLQPCKWNYTQWEVFLLCCTFIYFLPPG